MRPPAKALAVAIAADAVLAAIKIAAYLMTGSAAMLSEALRSTADVVNQGLLAVGIHRSRAAVDGSHPYGHGRERYIWALLSATGVLFIGAGATFWNGVQSLVSPAPLERLDVALGILALTLLAEGTSFLVALRAARASSHEADPVLAGILAEDGAGLVGLLFAAGGVGLAHATGNPIFDAVGALAVGLVMAGGAVFLIDRNRRLLIGRSPESERQIALAALTSNPMVREVLDVKVTLLDPDRVRFKAEVVFDGRALAEDWLAQHSAESLRERLSDDEAARAFLGEFAEEVLSRLGDEVDAIEATIREAEPRVRHIDLEVD